MIDMIFLFIELVTAKTDGFEHKFCMTFFYFFFNHGNPAYHTRDKKYNDYYGISRFFFETGQLYVVLLIGNQLRFKMDCTYNNLKE